MNRGGFLDPTSKACFFGILIVAVYGIHQASVGGDGVVFGTVIGALCAVGGYAFGVDRGR